MRYQRAARLTIFRPTTRGGSALRPDQGIGRWSAEVYLLFAEGRPDIWPAGDLAVQIEVGRILGHAERPSEEADARTRRRVALASAAGRSSLGTIGVADMKVI